MTQGQPAFTSLNAQGGIARRRTARAQRRRSLEDKVISRMKNRIASLQKHSATDRLNLRLADLEPYLPAVEASWERRHCNIVLTNFLKAGIQAGLWDVDRLPDMIVRLPRRPSPFKPERMTSARAITELKRRHEAALARILRSTRAPRSVLDDRLRAGQLIVSATVHGGLLYRPFVEALPKRMHTHLFEHDGRLWIDFEHGSGNDPDDVFRSPPSIRRWFPDPLTAMLLLRWRLDGCCWPARIGLSLDLIVHSYLSELEIALSFPKGKDALVRFGVADDQRVSIRQRSALHFLLEGARAHLSMWVPPVLADFASRPEMGCGLTLEAWTRTVTGQRLAKNPADIESEMEDGVISGAGRPGSPPSLARTRNEETQRAQLKALMSGLSSARGYVRRGPAGKFIEAFRREHSTNLCPVLRLLLDWSLWSITARDIGQGRIKVSSLVRYLSAIGPGLLDAGEDLTEDELHGRDGCTRLIDVYDTVVASVKERQSQPYVIDRLSEFHYYLSETLGTPAIQWRGRNIRARRRPHANVISETEYQAIRRSIENSKLRTRDRELLSLLLVCGYRLGLRRNEISGRQLNCFQGHPWESDLFRSIRPQLWIHVTAASSVKATASNRRTPMYHLLDADELELFHRWAERRTREIGRDVTGSELLFTRDAVSSAKLGDGDGFSQVSELIRAITGDATLDFYNLRHSFVTLTTARLLGAQVARRNRDWEDLLPWRLPESWTSPEKLRGVTLQKRLFLTDTVPRQAMFQVAALAGHIDPQETVTTYCHCLDLLLQGYLMAVASTLNKQTLSALLGHSASAERVRRHRRRSATFDEVIPESREMTVAGTLQQLIDDGRRKQIFASLPDIEPLEEHGIVAPDQEAERHFLSMEQLYSVLMTVPSRMSLADRARKADVGPETVSAIIASARHYAGEIRSDHRDTKVRRSRAVSRDWNHRHKDFHVRQKPEVIGYGRALPKPEWERKEAARVYQCLMAAALADPVLISHVEVVYRASSRSAAHLEISTADEANSLREVLRVAGIDRARLVATVLSIPREGGKADFRRELARRLEIPQRSIGFAEPLRRRYQGATFGRVALKLAPAGGKTGRSPYGWKVGLFYALVGHGVGTRLPRRD